MVDENGFPEDDDALSHISGDDLGLLEDLSNPQCLDRDLFLSTDTSQSSGDEDDDDVQDDTFGVQVEVPSLP